MGREVAVHAKGRRWQWGEGGKEMVAMGGGRAAGAPLDEGLCMEGRVALAMCGLCQRDPPSLNEMSFDALAGWRVPSAGGAGCGLRTLCAVPGGTHSRRGMRCVHDWLERVSSAIMMVVAAWAFAHASPKAPCTMRRDGECLSLQWHQFHRAGLVSRAY
ncbi:hypothetical protein B0H14DRAFT_2606271 [Mycena olivaceomarginata]|nr:hypothetical protein B0H14DRAFT_2606271 [Mycena olivaceomarginata]